MHPLLLYGCDLYNYTRIRSFSICVCSLCVYVYVCVCACVCTYVSGFAKCLSLVYLDLSSNQISEVNHETQLVLWSTCTQYHHHSIHYTLPNQEVQDKCKAIPTRTTPFSDFYIHTYTCCVFYVLQHTLHTIYYTDVCTTKIKRMQICCASVVCVD